MMKTYVVLLANKQSTPPSNALLNGHVDFLRKLKSEVRLMVCGLLVNNRQGMLVIKTDSDQHADQLMKEDPFVHKKYYISIKIDVFELANEENHWLTKPDLEALRKENI